MSGFIAVHAGAGYHSNSSKSLHQEACKEACLSAIALLRKGKNAVESVVAAVEKLENSSCTNAGLGSNLTLNGTVECDASVMDGDSLLFGAVGAVSGIQNPVLVGKCLLYQQKRGNLSMGRVPPCFLAGQGAQDWAISQGFNKVPLDHMITARTISSYKKYKAKLEHSPSKKKNVEDICNVSFLDVPQDTVGAVCVDQYGNVASAVSSGGLLLKFPGRIGQAAIYGSGCWAQNGTESKHAIAASTTGCGEYLIRTMLAKECCEAILSDELTAESLGNVFQQKFLDSPFLTNVTEKLCGILILKFDKDQQIGDCLWTYTSPSMCVGYMCSGDNKPTTRMSRQSDLTSSATSVVVEGVPCKL